MSDPEESGGSNSPSPPMALPKLSVSRDSARRC